MVGNKVIREAILWVIAFVTISPLITGCISTASMIADLKSETDVRINKSVRVVDVTGGQKSVFGIPMFVSNEEFKEALIASIEKSRAFKAVTDHDSDLDLYATIRAQDQQYPRVWEYRALLIVEYKFVDRNEGRVVWHETYQSEFSSVNSSLPGYISIRRTSIEAREGSVRENLSSLIKGIREHWPNTEK